MSSLGEADDEEPAVEPHRFLPADHPEWPGHWASFPAAWPEERVQRAEALELARRAILELPQTQRRVITLRDVEGWEAGETCQLLGLSESNQRVLLHRARSRVRRALERHLLAEGGT
jgi:RNA polymerase sigma-70 factor (ECF subfamily)